MLRFLLVLFLCFTGLGCGHIFYYPDSNIYVKVENLPIKPLEVFFDSSSDTKLSGWYFKSGDRPKAKILFFHGNAQNLTSHFASLYWILNHGYDYFIFDYPGYGKSEGKATQESTADAGTKALEWLAAQSPNVPIVIFGQSLGGNIAMQTMVENRERIKPCFVIVESTFKSYRKVAQTVMARHWMTWLFQGLPYLVIRDQYSANDKIDKISPTPLLVIHGDNDPIVAFENGEDVYSAARDPKQFFRVSGGVHTNSMNSPSRQQVREMLLKNLETYCMRP